MTGCNEAFIIDSHKRDELISVDPKSAEIIRPILRGRDIKRYGYEFGDVYIIATFPSRNYDINSYPAVKEYLLSFGYDKLKQTGDVGARKKTNNEWFETQDSISYWDDFFQQKLLWAETMRVHKTSTERFPRFGFDEKGGYLTDKTCFFATGPKIKSVMAILNSTMGRYLCSQYVSILDNGGYLMQKLYLEKIPLPTNDNGILPLVDRIIQKKGRIADIEHEIDAKVFSAYQLSQEEIRFICSTLQ